LADTYAVLQITLNIMPRDAACALKGSKGLRYTKGYDLYNSK